jgi:hypothetical protein
LTEPSRSTAQSATTMNLFILNKSFPASASDDARGEGGSANAFLCFLMLPSADSHSHKRERDRSVHTRRKEAYESKARASNDAMTARVCILGRASSRVEHRDRHTSSSKTPATTELLSQHFFLSCQLMCERATTQGTLDEREMTNNECERTSAAQRR